MDWAEYGAEYYESTILVGYKRDAKRLMRHHRRTLFKVVLDCEPVWRVIVKVAD
jgi:hypothetical protein